MGVSIDQWRSSIGMFAGGSRSSTTKYGRPPSVPQEESRWFQLGLLMLMLGVLVYTATLVGSNFDSNMSFNKQKLHLVILTVIVSSETAIVQLLAQGLVRGLLLACGDIESNPGPTVSVSEQSKRDSLAGLIREAPEKVGNVLMVWDSAKPSNVIRNSWATGRQFPAPDLKATLAWLTNTKESDYKTGWTKAIVADKVLLALEALLPDICTHCELEYCVNRSDTPSLKCMNCLQGVHEECLEGVAGLADLFGPQDGSLGSLSFTCKHCLSKKAAGRSHRVVVPATAVLPHHHQGQGDVDADLPTDDQQVEVDIENIPPPPLVPPSERGEVAGDLISENITEDSSRRVCEAFRKGVCPHGVSGKTGGTCVDAHPKRCPSFLKWGSKHPDYGCSGSDSGKLHPVI